MDKFLERHKLPKKKKKKPQGKNLTSEQTNSKRIK